MATMTKASAAKRAKRGGAGERPSVPSRRDADARRQGDAVARQRSAAKPRETYHHGNLAETLARAGEAVLRDVGLHAFSLREAARRAGVAHSAPAHHFGDVAGLLTEIAARGFDNLTASMRRARAGAVGPAALARIGRGYVRFATGDPVIFGLLFDNERLCASDRLNAAGRAAFAELVDAVASARGVDIDDVNDDDLRFAWSAIHGLSKLLISGALVPPGAKRPASDEAMINGTIERIVQALVTRAGEGAAGTRSRRPIRRRSQRRSRGIEGSATAPSTR